MKTSFTTRIIVEAGMMLALAWLLGRIKLWSAPMGGSVTAGSMVPLLLIAVLRGPKVGITVGAIYGLIDYLMGGYTVSVIQWFLDYPLAFACLELPVFCGIPKCVLCWPGSQVKPGKPLDWIYLLPFWP